MFWLNCYRKEDGNLRRSKMLAQSGQCQTDVREGAIPAVEMALSKKPDISADPSPRTPLSVERGVRGEGVRGPPIRGDINNKQFIMAYVE